MHGSTLIADFALVMGVAAVTAVLARLLRQPAIVGYLIAGLIVGPYTRGLVLAEPHRVYSAGDFGVILVLFSIGLDFRLRRLMRVLPHSGLTGLVQISTLLWIGFSIGRLFGWSTIESIFLGACICISSTMVVSRIFEDRRPPSNVREYVFGVLVLQDLVAIFLIATLTAVVAGHGLSAKDLALTVGRLGGILVAILLVGMPIIPRLFRRVGSFRNRELLGIAAIGFSFVMAWLAREVGFSIALGAFLAGMLVAESGIVHQVESAVHPVRDMFAGIFFVSIGMTVDPAQLWAYFPAALMMSAVIVIAQLASVSAAGLLSGKGLRESVTAAVALGQIGEFSFILAGIGIQAGVVRGALQPIVVTVAILTTLSTSFLVGHADPLVAWLDRVMPRRLRHLLGLYAEWFHRVEGARSAVAAGPLGRTVRHIWFDACALALGLVLLAVGWLGAARWIAERIHAEPEASDLVLLGFALLVLVPVVVALFRNLFIFGQQVVERVLPPDSMAEPMVRAAIFLLFALAFGTPMVAIFRPMMGGYTGIAMLGLSVVGVGIYLWKGSARLEDEFAKGVVYVSEALSKQAGQAGPLRLPDAATIPGLDRVFGMTVENASYAVDKTLAELNLRALTGATVVAIHRSGSDLVLPTGREKLLPGDVVGLIGTEEAIGRALELLHRGAIA